MDRIAGSRWWELSLDGLPACVAESDTFMNSEKWTRVFRHPRAGLDKTQATHGHLRLTP